MRTTRTARFGDRTYRVHYGLGSTHRLGRLIGDLDVDRRILVVSDPRVRRRHGRTLERTLSSSGFLTSWHVIPAGERGKTLASVEGIYQACVAAAVSKSSCLVAFGGGVVQDLTAYAAATYCRGVPYAQVPTTLLAQADVGFGGCAVDHIAGKSLIGAFYQPRLVVSDPGFLRTLPPAEISNGLAEVIGKVACIAGRRVDALLTDIPRMRSGDVRLLASYVLATNDVKRRIIERDETGRRGQRLVLDFGHTLTYALEAMLGYRMPHGRALGIGMRAAAWLSVRRGLLASADADRLLGLIRLAGLPTAWPMAADHADAVALVHRDQKVVAGRPRFVLLEGFGHPVLQTVKDAEVRACLRAISGPPTRRPLAGTRA